MILKKKARRVRCVLPTLFFLSLLLTFSFPQFFRFLEKVSKQKKAQIQNFGGVRFNLASSPPSCRTPPLWKLIGVLSSVRFSLLYHYYYYFPLDSFRWGSPSSDVESKGN